MANSGYWHGLYIQYRDEVKKYERNLRKLNDILGNYGDFEDEKGAVNGEIDDLIDDLKKGVRHNTTYTSNANSLEYKKEKSVGADSHLSSSMGAVQNEIGELNRKKSIAETNRDDAWRRYEEEKEEERKEMLNALLGR